MPARPAIRRLSSASAGTPASGALPRGSFTGRMLAARPPEPKHAANVPSALPTVRSRESAMPRWAPQSALDQAQRLLGVVTIDAMGPLHSRRAGARRAHTARSKIGPPPHARQTSPPRSGLIQAGRSSGQGVPQPTQRVELECPAEGRGEQAHTERRQASVVGAEARRSIEHSSKKSVMAAKMLLVPDCAPGRTCGSNRALAPRGPSLSRLVVSLAQGTASAVSERPELGLSALDQR